MGAETEQKIEFNPAEAFSSMELAEKFQRQSDQLRESVKRLAGTSTVNNCVVTVYEDGQAKQLPVTEYVEWLASEAEEAREDFVRYGGTAAAERYIAETKQAD